MNQKYWDESFTRRWFLPDQQTLPADAVEQIARRVTALQLDAAVWIRRLHAREWHEGCIYPLMLDTRDRCVACKTIYDLEQLLHERIYVQVSGVVIDFFHEPEHKGQLEEAVKLYAWAIFHQCKRREILRGSDEVLEYARHRVERLYSESYSHKMVSDEEDEGAVQTGETTRDDLQLLTMVFVQAYTELVHDFDAWRREHEGIAVSAFPAV